MFGKSKKEVKEQLDFVTQLYELRIADLKAQIEDLRSLTIPRFHPPGIPLIQYEADAIISGKQEITEHNENEAEKQAIESEAQRILSGTY